MRIIYILLMTALSGTVGFTIPEKSKTDPVAVVELFTSEGCSSCPAADELLQEMSELLQKEGKNVIPLAFHVTYWDHLGWKDPNSQEQFTTRQRKYVEALEVSRPYTPQAVINGQWEFVGSNPFLFREKVTEAMETRPQVDLDVKVFRESSRLELDYSASSVPGGTLLNVAIVQKRSEQAVKRGENRDKVLKHYNVVRFFTSQPLREKAHLSLDWPANLAPDNASVALYVQARNLQVVGAIMIKNP